LGKRGYFVAFFTSCSTVFDVLATKLRSPAYTAVTPAVPGGRVEVEKLAEPPLSVPVPSTVLPFMNETASPFGGAPSLEVTTAVKVTAWPRVEGFGEDVSVVAVEAADGFTSNTVPKKAGMPGPPLSVVP
jgi:hypothetical protein